MPTTNASTTPLDTDDMRDAMRAIRTPNILGTSVFGMPIVVNRYLAPTRAQIRFPKSKKKRIRKKWAQLERNFGYFETVIVAGDVVYVSPAVSNTLAKISANSPSNTNGE